MLKNWHQGSQICKMNKPGKMQPSGCLSPAVLIRNLKREWFDLVTIGILNTGMGNLGSIQRMIAKAGGQSTFVSSPEQFNCVSKIIMPGVGHFDEGMRALSASRLIKPMLSLVSKNSMPLLGICVGMQLLCRSSEEGNEVGLGLINAKVIKFRLDAQKSLKVPHMGWNIVKSAKPNLLLPHDEAEQRFYFVHSYHVVPDKSDIVIGTANHGGEFCAAFQKDNIFGVQFHPEKSHQFGMALMKRFLEL
jgi:glutamine amidotransferase